MDHSAEVKSLWIHFSALGLVLNVGIKLYLRHEASILLFKAFQRCCKPLAPIAIAVANKVSLIKNQLF